MKKPALELIFNIVQVLIDFGDEGVKIHTSSSIKNSLVVIFIIGKHVKRKSLMEGDPLVRRILENPDLISTVNQVDNMVNVDFVRKSDVYPSIQEFIAQGAYLVSIVVDSDSDEEGRSFQLKRIIKEELSFRSVLLRSELRNFIAEVVYMRLRLPALILFFLLLVINFFIFSKISSSLSQGKIEYKEIQRSQKMLQEASVREKELISRYMSIVETDYALVMDAIGISAPDNLILYNITIESAMIKVADKKPPSAPLRMILSGSCTSIDSVTAFVSSLSKCPQLGRIEVSKMSNDKKEGYYIFELTVEKLP